MPYIKQLVLLLALQQLTMVSALAHGPGAEGLLTHLDQLEAANELPFGLQVKSQLTNKPEPTVYAVFTVDMDVLNSLDVTLSIRCPSAPAGGPLVWSSRPNIALKMSGALETLNLGENTAQWHDLAVNLGSPKDTTIPLVIEVFVPSGDEVISLWTGQFEIDSREIRSITDVPVWDEVDLAGAIPEDSFCLQYHGAGIVEFKSGQIASILATMPDRTAFAIELEISHNDTIVASGHAWWMRTRDAVEQNPGDLVYPDTYATKVRIHNTDRLGDPLALNNGSWSLRVRGSESIAARAVECKSYWMGVIELPIDWECR